eukprot:Skav219050  [mRNA]  locus=scaffold1033:26624:27460:+ [translate_table: standard]
MQPLQLATWNVHGKPIEHIVEVLADQRISFDVLALQEVGALPQGTASDPCILDAANFPVALRNDLSDYWILGTNDLQSHLGQALLLDKTLFSAVLKTHHGRRCLGTKVALTSGGFLWILGVHLPHHANDMDAYVTAVRELHAFIDKVHGAPFLIAGDWNSQPGMANMDQRALEISCLAAEVGLHIAMPTEPTWHDRVYDFFLVSPLLAARSTSIEESPPHLIAPLRDVLPSDHHLVAWTIRMRSKPKQRAKHLLSHRQVGCQSRHLHGIHYFLRDPMG